VKRKSAPGTPRSSEANNLSDNAFAVVLAGGEKDGDGKTVPRSLRKLPHHDDSVTAGKDNGSVDLPHLRNALAREPQTDMPDADHAKAKSHLGAHAKELLESYGKALAGKAEWTFDFDVAVKERGYSAVYQQVTHDIDEDYTEEVDLPAPSAYVDPNTGQIIAPRPDTVDVPMYSVADVFPDSILLVSRAEGDHERYWRVDYAIENDEVVVDWDTLREQTTEHVDKPEASKLFSFKAADGRNLWMLLTGSCFKDRDREIISARSIDLAVEEMDATGDYGQLDLYHVPIYVGKCLTSGRQGGFLVELGEWYDTPIALAAKKWAEANPDDVGASVAFTYAPKERVDGVYYGPISIKGRALLDVRDAACPWSGFVQIGEESMAKNIKDKLLAILGSEDLVSQGMAGLAKADKLTEELIADGVMHKESAESAAEATKEESPDGQTVAALGVVDQSTQEVAQGALAQAGNQAVTEETVELVVERAAAEDAMPDKMQVAELDDTAIQAIASRVAESLAPTFAKITDVLAAFAPAVQELGVGVAAMQAKQDEATLALAELARSDEEKIAEKVGNTPRYGVHILSARGKSKDDSVSKADGGTVQPKNPKAEADAQKEIDKANGTGKKSIFSMTLQESMAAVRAANEAAGVVAPDS